MIDTASLMRFNLVQTKRYGVVRISSILTNSVWILSNDTPPVACNMKLSDLTPIVITGKILIACGFKETPMMRGNQNRWQLSGINIERYDYGFVFNGGEYKSAPFHYLHQIQNMYKFLTGYELEIKLPID